MNICDTGLAPDRHQVKAIFPTFTKPEILGYFSVTTERQYAPNAKELRYYCPPVRDSYPLNLNEGLDRCIRKPESAYDEKLDILLQYMCGNKRKIRKDAHNTHSWPLLNTEFVCWRGLLTLIMGTPYEEREGWSIWVTRYKGTFYMCKRETHEQYHKRQNETAREKRMSSWGFKFEQYCLSESPSHVNHTDKPVDECAEFTCVFKTVIGGLTLLYGAEMDGIKSPFKVNLDAGDVNLNELKFVELKVQQGNMNKRQLELYERVKTRKWWCQSFLVGISDIYVGQRNENGEVYDIKEVKVRQLPKIANKLWSPNVCAQFLIKFLHCVRNVVTERNCPYTTYEFDFNPNTKKITYKCFEGSMEYQFMPDWYIKFINDLEKRAMQSMLQPTVSTRN